MNEKAALLATRLNSDHHNFAYMEQAGWTYLTDWTFTAIFPLTSMLKEGNGLIDYYTQGKSHKGIFNKFMLTFGDKKGHLDLWGKLEEDFAI